MIRLSRRSALWLFLTPYLALTALFFVWPFCDAIRLAFYQTNGARSQVAVGLQNFMWVLGDPDFHLAVKNTIVFAMASIFIQLPLALALALMLQDSKSRFASVARLVLFSPHLVGQIFVGIMFGVLLMPRFGLINQALQSLLGWGLEERWLADPTLVMPAIILTSMWMYVGFNMIYFLAALQNVDHTLKEAARIDGAGRWQVFRHVTLPAIKPVAVFVVITSTIGSFQLFELPYALLDGKFGPANSGLTIVGYLYGTAFEAGDLGTGAAVGWILTLIIFIISLIQIRLTGSHKD
jgi:ABC-type sugar transport system permease subunit